MSAKRLHCQDANHWESHSTYNCCAATPSPAVAFLLLFASLAIENEFSNVCFGMSEEISSSWPTFTNNLSHKLPSSSSSSPLALFADGRSGKSSRWKGKHGMQSSEDQFLIFGREAYGIIVHRQFVHSSSSAALLFVASTIWGTASIPSADTFPNTNFVVFRGVSRLKSISDSTF